MGVRTLEPPAPPIAASEEPIRYVPARFPPAVLAILAVSDTVEVMSVDPNSVTTPVVNDKGSIDEVELSDLDSMEANRPGLIQGHRVLGSVRVPTLDRGRAVAEALAESNRTVSTSTLCFDPDFAVRVTHAGQVADFLICFSCLNVRVYGPGTHTGIYPIGRSPSPLLRRELRRGGVGWLWFWRRWLG